MYTFLCGRVSFSWVYRSRIDRSYGNYVFNFLRYHRTLFQSSCTVLHSERQGVRAQFLHILTNTCYFVFSILGVLVGVKCYPIMVLICIFS